MHPLFACGWSDHLESLLPPDLVPARVVADHGDLLSVATRDDVLTALISGRLQYSTSTPTDLPATGDRVGLRMASDPPMVEAVLPRTSRLVRKRAGRTSRGQVVAANVDRVFVVTSANDELSERRLERYLATVLAAGCTPILVVNKLDLAPEPETWLDRARSVAGEAPVLGLSAATGLGLEAFDAQVLPGCTHALVGSSGVGKSTLLNHLLGDAVQRTHPLRHDDTGKHTTSHRELFAVPGRDAVVLDTPGMRELALVDGAGLGQAFADIEALAQACRYRDCGHAREPGCAVQAAVERGELPPGRLVAWGKLQREAVRQEALAEQATDWQQRREQRRFARQVKAVVQERSRRR